MRTDNKILAASIAAALLVGGGAVAAFNEMRAAAQTAPQASRASVAASLQPAAVATPVLDAPLLDTAPEATVVAQPAAVAVAAEAPILGVSPVKQTGNVSARVLDIDQVTRSVAQTTPRQVCRDVVVQERLPERDRNIGGTVIGAVIGGLAGNQIGDGRGRDAATVAGAAAGGYIGNRIDKRHVGGRVVNRTEQRCDTVSERSSTDKVIGYDVTYRMPDGSTGIKRTTSRPGNTVQVKGATTTAYDVTYSYNGRQRTVRLDDRPRGDAFPVVDGRVVTTL